MSRRTILKSLNDVRFVKASAVDRPKQPAPTTNMLGLGVLLNDIINVLLPFVDEQLSVVERSKA